MLVSVIPGHSEGDPIQNLDEWQETEAHAEPQEATDLKLSIPARAFISQIPS